MYSLSQFTLSEMTECGAALRKLGAGVSTMEETANNIVRYFYDQFLDIDTHESAIALVRFFKTHSYDRLPTDLKQRVQQILNTDDVPADLRCLMLLGTAGDRPEWNTRHQSTAHQVIPLASASMVRQAPMISQLIKQLGLTIDSVIAPDPDMIVDLQERTYNVFHIPNALGSPYIPAQKNFVEPCGIQSVLGFGGILPSGNLITTVMFSKVSIKRDTAELFKPLALNTKMAILPFDQGAVFTPVSIS